MTTSQLDVFKVLHMFVLLIIQEKDVPLNAVENLCEYSQTYCQSGKRAARNHCMQRVLECKDMETLITNIETDRDILKPHLQMCCVLPGILLVRFIGL